MRMTGILLFISLLILVPQTHGQTPREAETKVLALNEQGVQHAQDQQYERAVVSFRAAIRRAPQESKFHTNLGVLYLNWGRPDDALDPLLEAFRLEPNAVETHYNLGVAYGELGRHAEAIELYEKAIRRGFTNASLFWKFGLVVLPQRTTKEGVAEAACGGKPRARRPEDSQQSRCGLCKAG